MQRKRALTIAVLGFALFFGAFSEALAGYDDYFTGALRHFKRPAQLQPLPAVSFLDGNGNVTGLQAFKGRVVLLALWATWCPYCRQDMPKLDMVQKELGPRGLSVVALSVDSKGIEVVRDYYAREGYSLPIYVDPSSRVAPLLGLGGGIPAFVLIDREGREIGRIAGQTNWMSDEAAGFLKKILSNG